MFGFLQSEVHTFSTRLRETLETNHHCLKTAKAR